MTQSNQAKSNRIGRTVFALMAAAALAAGVSAFAGVGGAGGFGPETAWADSGKIVIVHTNDVHCGYDATYDGEGGQTSFGYSDVAGYYNQVKAENDGNAVLVDAGDYLSGGFAGTLSTGEYLVKIMNAAGYEVASVGNHEFDFKASRLIDLAENKADFNVVSCNFDSISTGETVFDPYAVVEVGGKKIAFVGVSTPESLTASNPSNFYDETGTVAYSFCQDSAGGELYTRIQQTVDKARMEGADYVILLAHLGQEGSTHQWRSDTVVANTNGVDAVVDAHSHEQYVQMIENLDGEKVPIAQTGTSLASIGVLTIDIDSGEITAELVKPGDVEITPDEATQAIADQVTDDLEAIRNEQIGTTENDLLAVTRSTEDPTTGKRLARTGETNLGDLVADSQRAIMGTQISLVNGGSVRADIPAGPVTKGDVINVQPFLNDLCAAQVTGQQLLDALEMGARLYPEENGGFLQVSGMSYEINADIPSSVVLDENGAFVKVDGERRVQNVCVGDEPISPDATYTVASYSFLFNGGDGFSMLKDCPQIDHESMLDYEATIRFISQNLDGTIGEDYANGPGQGRVLITHNVDPDDDDDEGDDPDDEGDDPDDEGDDPDDEGDDPDNPDDGDDPDDSGNRSGEISPDTGDHTPLTATAGCTAAAFLLVIVSGAMLRRRSE